MLNQNIIVGRIANDSVLLENKDNEKYNTITIAVQRTYKNKNGEYDVDFIDVQLTKMLAENTSQYCKKGDVIGIKGRLETRKVKPEEKIDTITELIAEKVTFLSSGKGEDDENTSTSL